MLEGQSCPSCHAPLPADSPTHCACGRRLRKGFPLFEFIFLSILPLSLGLYLCQFGGWRPYEVPWYIGLFSACLGGFMLVVKGLPQLFRVWQGRSSQGEGDSQSE